MPPAAPGPGRARARLGLALIVLVTAVLYWPVRGFEFVNYDDPAFITANLRMQEGLSLRNVGWAFTVSIASNWHPLTTLTHLADCSLYGLDAGGHHLTSLLFHLANVVVLYLLLRRLSLSAGAALLVAGLFAVHPINVESVAWVSERKNVLSELFLFLTLYTWVDHARTGSRRAYAAALLLFTAGLMSKTMLVSVPVLLLLLDLWPLGRGSLASARTALRDLARLLPEKLPFVALSLAACVVTVVTQRATPAVGALESFPMAARLMNAAVSYVAYVRDVFYPAHLSPFYPHLGMDTGVWRSLGAAAALAAATAAAWWQRARRPYLLVGWAWYLVTLVPVIGIVQVGAQARADRYAYMPLVGLFLILALLAEELAGRLAVGSGARYAAGGLLLAGLAAVARPQVLAWHDGQALFERARRALPEAHLDHDRRGVWLVQQRRFDEAGEQFEAALAIQPDFADAWSHLGQVRLEQGRAEEAVHCYEQAIRVRRDSPRDLNNLATALARLRRFAEAKALLEEALALDPAYVPALFNHAAMLQELGRTGDAVAEFRSNGLALAAKGEQREALASYEAALRLAPDDAQARSGAEEARRRLAVAGAGASR